MERDFGQIRSTDMIEPMAHTGAPALDSRAPMMTVDVPGPPAPRRTRFAAAFWDLSWLGLGSLLAVAVGFGFLFWRTRWGAVDAGDGDTALAAALVLSVVPTWLTWLLASMFGDGGTPGQHRRGLVVGPAVHGWPVRLLRFALHPLSAPGWIWLAAILFLMGAPSVGWLLIVAAAVVHH